MNSFLTVRRRLDLTQADLAAALGMSQGNISFYENGQTVPPSVAAKLIEVAKTLGHEVSFDDLYGQLTDGVPPPPAQAGQGD